MASNYSLIGKCQNITVSGKSVKTSFDKTEKIYKFHGSYLAKDKSAGDFYKAAIQNHVKNAVSGQSASVLTFAVSENNDLGGQFGQTCKLIQSAIDDVFPQTSNDDRFVVASSMLNVSSSGILLDALNPHNRDIVLKNHAATGIYADGLSDLVSTTAGDTKRLYEEACQVVTSQSPTAYLYTLTLWRDVTDKKGAGSREVRSTIKFLFVAVTKENLTQIDDLVQQASKADPTQKLDHNLTLLIRDCVHSNSASVNIACILKTDCSSAEAHSCLSNVEYLGKSNPPSSPSSKPVDTNTLLNNLRDELASVRQKVSLDVVPKIRDVEKMEKLMEDIRETKRSAKSQVQWKSERFFAERRSNYANMGLAWILTDSTLSHIDQAKINEQKKMIEKLSEDHRKQKEMTDNINTELKNNIASYTDSVNKGTENKDQISIIQKMKEQYRVESEKLKQLRSNLKVARKQLQGDTQTVTSSESASFQFLYKSKCEELGKMKEENEAMVQQEIESMKAEMDREKVSIEMQYANKEVKKEQAIELATNASKLQSEKSVLTMQLEALKRERVEMMNTIEQLSKKHDQEMEVQQLQNMQTFRAYREMFENYKLELENRWRNLLGEAIQDAVFLASRNSQLNEQNLSVKQENSRLKESVGSK